MKKIKGARASLPVAIGVSTIRLGPVANAITAAVRCRRCGKSFAECQAARRCFVRLRCETCDETCSVDRDPSDGTAEEILTSCPKCADKSGETTTATRLRRQHPADEIAALAAESLEEFEAIDWTNNVSPATAHGRAMSRLEEIKRLAALLPRCAHKPRRR